MTELKGKERQEQTFEDARQTEQRGILATDQVIPSMRQHLFAVVLLSVLGNSAWAGGSWIFQPSTYSHDHQTGERVAQFAVKPPVYGPSDPTYEQSAYIHKRTSLRGVGGSVERRHYVETWGAGEAIRPYGEWQRPFRAGATPFGPWGNPSGPWTLPYDSWVNPYGLGKLPTPPWYPWYPRSGYYGGGYGSGDPEAGYPGMGYPGTGYPPYGYGNVPHVPAPRGDGAIPGGYPSGYGSAPGGGHGGMPAGQGGGHGGAPSPSQGHGQHGTSQGGHGHSS